MAAASWSATASGIAPRLLTPTTREFWMSGSEYQANITSMLLQHSRSTLPTPGSTPSVACWWRCVILLGLRLPWLVALCSLPMPLRWQCCAHR